MSAYDPQYELCKGILDALVKVHGRSAALAMADAAIGRAIEDGLLDAVGQMGEHAQGIAKNARRAHAFRRAA